MSEFPTFFQKESVLEFWLENPAVVTIKLYDENEGFLDFIIENQKLNQGNQKLTIRKSCLKKGKYSAKIYIKNFNENITETLTVSVE